MHLSLPGGLWCGLGEMDGWFSLGCWTGCQKTHLSERHYHGALLIPSHGMCFFFFLACVTFIKFSKIWLKDLKRVIAKGVQDQRCVCKTEVIRAEKGLWPVGTHLL